MRVFRFHEELILRDLWGRLKRMLDMNAALGYIVDPRYPAPEVLERPGWVRHRVGEGSVAVCIAYSPDLSVLDDGPVGPDSVDVRHDEAGPLVECECRFAEDESRIHIYGLGLHVPSRRILVFHRAEVR